MKSLRRYLPYRFIPVFLALFWLCPFPCASNQDQKQLLVLHSYRKADWTDSLLAGIESVLESTEVAVSVEYMDTRLIKSDAYYRALDQVYGLKYGNIRFDVILATDDNAYRYALERQVALFKQAPIVFCGVNRFNPQEIENNPLVTGVVEKGDFQDTLQFALRARPRAETVHVIVDHTHSARINLKDFFKVIRQLSPTLAVHQLIDLSIPDLGAGLAALPVDDFAFFISYWHDDRGAPVSPDFLSEAFSRSAIPIFGRSEWMMTKGLTGGKCVSGFHQGEAAAKMARRILSGETAASVPVILDSPNRFMFDYQLLKRFGIDPATVPKDSLLFNKPQPAYFESHQALIWSVLAILAVLTLLVVVLSINMATRRKTETALRESEARYRQLVQHAPSAIYEIDLRRWRFMSVNDVMCAYTGYTQAEVTEMDPAALIIGEDLPKVQQMLDTITPDHPTPPAVEYRIRTKEGRIMWVLMNCRFRFEEGKPVTLMAIVHDISALRAAEEGKKALEAKLTQIQKLESLGTLAGGIAHDFNNLLMGVMGNVSLMQMDEGRSHEDLERLGNIETFVQRGGSLTGQLLGLARGGKYEVKPTNLNLLINQSATMFGRTKKEIRIHLRLQEELWSVECDQNQMDQVLLNIFINAWQAMPNGGDLYVYTENAILDQRFVQAHAVPPGRYVKISISDTGIGMDQATMAKIFDPFFTTKERERGTGLGLASAYGIIKNHGGIIDVASLLGHGSTFHIYLPVVDKNALKETPGDVLMLKGSERILLIDDEAMVLNVAQKMLDRLGYRVITAASGREAIEVYQRSNGSIDLVLLDMIMPGISGAETFFRLQQIDPQVRVLLSSGYSINGQATELIAQGCRGFIQKPFRAQELSQKIRAILDGH